MFIVATDHFKINVASRRIRADRIEYDDSELVQIGLIFSSSAFDLSGMQFSNSILFPERFSQPFSDGKQTIARKQCPLSKQGITNTSFFEDVHAFMISFDSFLSFLGSWQVFGFICIPTRVIWVNHEIIVHLRIVDENFFAKFFRNELIVNRILVKCRLLVMIECDNKMGFHLSAVHGSWTNARKNNLRIHSIPMQQ